jgi:hypothetical protein
MKNKIIKYSLATVIGASLGFAYYWFIGCNTGSCPIVSNPYFSSIIGSVIGISVVWK